MRRSLGVTEAIREVIPDWSIPVFELLALPGDLPVIVVAVGLLFLADVIGIVRPARNDERLCSNRTMFVIATVFGGLALVVLAKAAFASPRPPETLHAVSPSEYGFPSGHTMAATVTWGAFALWVPLATRRTRIALATAFVLLVALSRLALGVHYLVDVVAAVSFGVIYLVAMGWGTDRRPLPAFAVAVAIAAIAVFVAGGSSRSLLALLGTVGAVVGWLTLERPPVRRRVQHVIGRLVDGKTGFN